MRKLGIRVLLTLLIGAGLLLAGLEGLNHTPLIDQIRRRVEREATKTLGQPVTIGKLSLSLWHGINAGEIAVAGSDGKMFLQAERISGGVVPLPTGEGLKLLVPELTITRPQLFLRQDAKGSWNLPVPAARPAAQATPEKKPGGTPPVWIPKLSLVRGTAEIYRTGLPPLFVNPFDLTAQLELPGKVQAVFSGKLQRPAVVPLEVSFQYDGKTERLRTGILSTLPLGSLTALIPEMEKLPVQELRGKAQLVANIEGDPRGILKANLKLDTEELGWSIPHPFPGRGGAAAPKLLTGSGDVRLKIATSLSTQDWAKNLQWRTLLKQATGSLTLKGVEIGPFPEIGEIRNLQGELGLGEEGIRAKGLRAEINGGRPIHLNLLLRNDDYNSFEVSAAGSLPASKLAGFIPGVQIKEPGQWKGEVEIDAKGTGQLLPVFEITPDASIQLTGISGPVSGDWGVEGLTGALHLKPDLLTISEISGKVGGQPLRLEGTLVNFKRPEATANIHWGKLTGELQAQTMDGDRMKIESAQARWGGSSLRVFGEIAGLKKAEGPRAHLYGEASVGIAETRQIAGPLLPIPADLDGNLSARAEWEGPLKIGEGTIASLHVNSPRLKTQGMELRGAALELEASGNDWRLERFDAGLFGGNIAVSGAGKIDPANPAWRGQMNLRDLRLEDLARHFQMKDQQTSGLLQMDWSGQGSGNKLAAIQGNGNLQIVGKIFSFPFLGPFAELLSMPGFEQVTFQEVTGPFGIRQGQVESAGIQARAPQMTLLITGNGGFLQGADSAIDWRIQPALTTELLPKGKTSKIGEILARSAGALVADVRMTGSWKNPKRQVSSKPMEQLLNQELPDLQGLLKDIF